MKLGVNLIHDGAVALARTAEALGYDLVLAPEGNRSDAPSVLGAVAAATERIGLASGVMQIPARTPALAALTAATLDELSAGRFRLGLGVSNADVSEGWYGAPFDRPLGRVREYVCIVRAALRRETVRFAGEHYRLPSGPGGARAPLVLPTPPVRPEIPIYLAAVGPRSLALAGEIADGWIGVFASPDRVAAAVAIVGAARLAAGRPAEGFEIIPSVAASVAPDPVLAAGPLRAHMAHLLGLGTAERNVYCGLASDLGFRDAVERIRRCRAGGDLPAAAAAVPFEFIDQVALVGPVPRIAGRLAEYAAAGTTTLSVMVSAVAASPAARLGLLRDMAHALTLSGAG